jgi:Putative lumazine-binding
MGQSEADTKAIITTAMNYFEGWFDGDAARMERALHPYLNKRRVSGAAPGAMLSNPSTAAQMVKWTIEGEGKAIRPADLTIKVRVDDIYGNIATATVYSTVYVEYLQLMRTHQGWKIVNALWMDHKK